MACPGLSRLLAPARGAAGRFVLALAASLTGGALFHAFGLPLPWMLGAILLSTIAAVAGLPVAIPGAARSLMLTVLGVMLGSAFTPEVLQSVALWLGSIAGMVVYAIAVSLAVYVVLRRLLGYDPVTAFFAGTPGGLSEMTLIGGALGGDERAIALTHSLRIVLIVFAIAFGFQWFGGYVPSGAAAAGRWVPVSALAGGDVAVLLVCGILGALGGRRLRLPAAMLLGPMILSAAAHLAGLTAVPPPSVLVAAAQVVVGGAIGCRFAGTPLRLILRTAASSLGVAGLMLAATLAFAAVLAPLTGLPFAALVLAFAPGGLAEMALIALALGIDTAFVSTHNVFRVLAIIVLAPLVFRFVGTAATPPPRTAPGDD